MNGYTLYPKNSTSKNLSYKTACEQSDLCAVIPCSIVDNNKCLGDYLSVHQ